jgi:hypothetical protein
MPGNMAWPLNPIAGSGHSTKWTRKLRQKMGSHRSPSDVAIACARF